MARRAEEHPRHSSSWKIALADLMTVLMVFFLVMWLSATLEPEQRQKLSEQIVEGGTGVQENEPPPNEQQIPILPELKPKEVEPVSAKKLQESLKGLDAQIQETEDQILITLKSDLVFESGRATVNEKTRAELERVGEEMSNFASAIHITGHTDNVPISTLAYPSNWELSAARAATVARIFIYMGVDAKWVTIQGRADAEPLAPNDTRYGRSLNRRVLIAIDKNNPLKPQSSPGLVKTLQK